MPRSPARSPHSDSTPRPAPNRLGSSPLGIGLALLLAAPLGSLPTPAYATASRERPPRARKDKDAAQRSSDRPSDRSRNRTRSGRTRSATQGQSTAIDPDIERAKAIYEEGEACFETFDYEGAVERWTEAYAALPPEADEIRTRVVYNIATAQQRAYDVDHDVGHLRQAVMLLEQYITQVQALHEPDETTQAHARVGDEIDKARARIQELQERIERADQPTDPTATDPADPANGSASSTSLDGIVWRPSITPADPEQQARNRKLALEDRTTDRLLIASTVTLSLGGLLTLTGVGLAAGTGTDDAGERGGSYGTLALGLVGVTTGVTLLAVGLQRRKKARKGTLVTAVPAVSPGFAGGSVGLRF